MTYSINSGTVIELRTDDVFNKLIRTLRYISKINNATFKRMRFAKAKIFLLTKFF